MFLFFIDFSFYIKILHQKQGVYEPFYHDYREEMDDLNS